MKIDLNLHELQDDRARDNFVKIKKALASEATLKGNWSFFEITISKAVTNYKFLHNLGFTPKDVIQTSLTGAGSLTWNFSKFDKNYLDITTTGACVVRAFVGLYKEDS